MAELTLKRVLRPLHRFESHPFYLAAVDAATTFYNNGEHREASTRVKICVEAMRDQVQANDTPSTFGNQF